MELGLDDIKKMVGELKEDNKHLRSQVLSATTENTRLRSDLLREREISRSLQLAIRMIVDHA